MIPVRQKWTPLHVSEKSACVVASYRPSGVTRLHRRGSTVASSQLAHARWSRAERKLSCDDGCLWGRGQLPRPPACVGTDPLKRSVAMAYHCRTVLRAVYNDQLQEARTRGIRSSPNTALLTIHFSQLASVFDTAQPHVWLRNTPRSPLPKPPALKKAHTPFLRNTSRSMPMPVNSFIPTGVVLNASLR